MLNLENKTKTLLFIYLISLFISCNQQPNKKNSPYEKSVSTIGIKEYDIVYEKVCDSLLFWLENNCNSYPARNELRYKLDSLLCFNTNNDRFISCIHCTFQGVTAMDDLHTILGEKMNNQWYFFSGSTSIVLPRKWYQKNETTPLSYAKMHEIALKEIYGGYLLKNGEINENWFINHFEGAGWGKYPETLEDIEKLTRRDYEKRHLDKVRNNWYGVKKDSLKQLQKKNEALP